MKLSKESQGGIYIRLKKENSTKKREKDTLQETENISLCCKSHS